MSSKREAPAWVGFASGALAAMAAGAVTHPIDLIKVRMQLFGAKDGFEYGSSHVAGHRPPGVLATFSKVARAEGVPALYKGLSASLLRQATFIGTKFGVYDVLKDQLVALSPDGELSFGSRVVCGMTAGAVGAVVGNPCDLAMVRMQADGRLPVEKRRNYRNGIQAVYRVAREEGAFALWRGSMPTVGRAVVITASQFAVYDWIKLGLMDRHSILSDGPMLHITSSMGCSIVASITSNPFDVVKSRLQQMTRRTRDGIYPYRGMLDCFVKTARAEGVLALYKGLVPTACRQLPLNVVRFVCVEQLRTLFTHLNDSYIDPIPLEK